VIQSSIHRLRRARTTSNAQQQRWKSITGRNQ